MSWASDLPAELLSRPTGLVVLTGLDTTYNAVHHSIWDSFCNNRRSDRVPLHFRVMDADHEYPKCKPKKSSYEWYIPKGILKTNWMKKQLYELPAIVVVFFDLDWNETMWKEKQMECATRLDIVRDSLTGRGARMCVVLIQKNAPLPPGEDVIAPERAASFCSACDLASKSLFVLPHTDHLYGYTIRLENAFYEQVQSYYHTEARRVKAHKDFLNKTTHQLLFVRHQFKIAFFNELKQDSHTALKNYKQAYGHILELRVNNTNILEVKTVAGFINYKICKLSFQHNAPLDAISQFRKHIDFYKKQVGMPELAFEHSAWMSKQFQAFGDIFDESIKLGLTAIQTQHPGFYYQQAANHAISRKKLCRGLCHPIQDITPSPLEALTCLDFYGQRPWRQGHQSIDPPDMLKEKSGIQALQNIELKEEHSGHTIPLLSSAVAQFKKYKSPRMKRSLMVQLGEEYYNSKDYNRALTVLSRVTYDYRFERWWPLLTSILITSLRCAYLVENVQQYVTLCLELIGKHVKCSPEDKTRIQMNLVRVMSNNPPEPEPGCDTDCVDKAKPLWRSSSLQDASSPCLFTVDMMSIIPFVECKALFSADSVTADRPVTLNVFIRTHCEFPIQFSKLNVLFEKQEYNSHCVVSDNKDISTSVAGNLYLIPQKTIEHVFTFLPHAEDVGKEIKIKRLCLELGLTNRRCASLQWEGPGGDALPTTPFEENRTSTVSASVNIGMEHIVWEQQSALGSISVLPRPSRLEVKLSHSPPVLVNEFYPITIDISNTEPASIMSASLYIGTCPPDTQLDTGESNLSVVVCLSVEEISASPLNKRLLALSTMEPGDQTSHTTYIRCLHQSQAQLFIRITYNVEIKPVMGDPVVCTCYKEEVLQFEAVDPFQVLFRLSSLMCEELETVHADEPFLLMPGVNCTSEFPISIKRSLLEPSAFVKREAEVIRSKLHQLTLQKGDIFEECYDIVCSPSLTPSIPLGSYTIFWRRQCNFSTAPYVSTTFNLPTVNIELIPLYVELHLPSHGTLRCVLPAVYYIHNRTSYSQEIEVNMEASEQVMFAGHKQVHFRILPNSHYQLKYNLIPLVAGNVQLPRLHINMLRYPGTMDSIVRKMVPTHVFVMPQSKK